MVPPITTNNVKASTVRREQSCIEVQDENERGTKKKQVLPQQNIVYISTINLNL